MIQSGGDTPVRQSTTLFASNKSIIQLLKKSLLSITIADKKEILNILDDIQVKIDQDDDKNINKQFQNLIKATVDSCLTLNYKDVIFESLKIFKAIGLNSKATVELQSREAGLIVVESEIMEHSVTTVKSILELKDIAV